MTSIYQPMDAGVIAALKRRYKRRLLDVLVTWFPLPSRLQAPLVPTDPTIRHAGATPPPPCSNMGIDYCMATGSYSCYFGSLEGDYFSLLFSGPVYIYFPSSTGSSETISGRSASGLVLGESECIPA